MKRSAGVALLLVMAIALPASAATTKTVTASGTSFSPRVMRAVAGKTVTWVNEGGTHNVRSATGMFVTDASQWPYSRVFSAGTFGYYCEIHSGMSGKVRIKPTMSHAPDGSPFTVRWATGSTNTGSQFKVQYRVDGGSWKTWRSSTSGVDGVFGQGGAPTTVVSGRSYGFRVKSISGYAASRYSPVRNVRP